MRSRCLLHKNKIDEFAKWLFERGWKKEDTKGFYEVLRMRHPRHKDPLIVYYRLNAKEHLTVHGVALEMSRQFVREKFYSSIPEDSIA